MKLLNHSLIVSIFLCLISCKNEVSKVKNTSSAYIIGEIANPHNNYITILQSNGKADTLFLDEHNQFQFRFDSAASDIYWMKHFSESQLFFLEPGDSLGIYLNTEEFDESLSFSGEGSEKNNLLIDMFLEDENSVNFIKKSESYPPKEFKKISDSIYHNRIKELKRQRKKFKFSDAFTSFAKTSADYQYYFQNEQYVYLQNKYNRSNSINKTFLAYRDSLDFNSKRLSKSFIYLRTLDIYIKNITAEHCVKTNSTDACYKENELTNLRAKLVTVDSIIKEQSVKQRFIKRLGTEALLLSNTMDVMMETMKVVHAVHPSVKSLDFFNNLADLQRTLFPGKSVSNLIIQDSTGKKEPITNRINSKTVVYFWNNNYSQRLTSKHHKINQLLLAHPDYEFLAVNTDLIGFADWKELLDNYNYNFNTELRLVDAPFNSSLYTDLVNKVIFVEKDGTIVSGDAILQDTNFEEKLNAFF
jgi:hypothetical protein